MDAIAVRGAVLSAMALGAQDAPPLVMLHGLVTGNMASWYSSAALPLSATHRVLLYDLRGHGGSTVPASGYDLQSQARDLEDVLAFYGYAGARVDMVGHSMGALIALHFALRHPARVGLLVLVDAPMPASTHVAPSLQRIADDPGTYFRAGSGSGRRRERLLARIEKFCNHTSLLEDVSAMQAEPDDLLADFQKPVKLIYGARSPCREAAVHLRERLPFAKISWLEAGHDLPEEAPGQLLQEIGLFLACADAQVCHPHLRTEAV